MKVLIYSTKKFEQPFLTKANKQGHESTCIEQALNIDSATLASGYDAVSIFTADDASEKVIDKLHELGVKYLVTRSAGHDHIALQRAAAQGIKVGYVPEYSPYAVAEHAISLLLALNRKLIIADRQLKNYDFTVDNLVGFDLFGKKAGVIGTGRIGSIAVRILHGFGCRLMGYDIKPDQSLKEKYGIQYTDLDTLCSSADIILLQTPLNAETRHMINKQRLGIMKPGVILINTARGPVIDTNAALEALEKGKIGGLGIDVYENEKGIFFYDHSGDGIKDELLKKLMQLPNVLITPHCAFATKEAITNIADTTFYNIDCWASGKKSENELA